MIGPDALVGPKQVQEALSRVRVGDRLNANVIGPTRHGLAVHVGSETLWLNAKVELPNATRVTLQITTTRNGGEQGVQILAADDRLLDEPIRGSLIARSVAPKSDPGSSILARNHQIEVQARPISVDGKWLAPPITVRLTVEAVASAVPPNRSSTEKVARNFEEAAVDDGALAKLRSTAPASKLPSIRFPHPTDLQKTGGLPPLPPRTGSGPVSMPLQQGSAPSATSISAPFDGAGTTIPIRGATQAITATVIAQLSDEKQTLLQTHDNALMKVESPIDLPIGTTLQMTMLGTPMNTVQAVGSRGLANHDNPLTRLVQLLSDIEQSGQSTSDSHAHRKTWHLPIPDRHLAARLLQLMGLQTGYRTDEPGISAQDRLQGNPSWTHQLQGLLSDIGGAASEHLTDGWRGTTLPLGIDPAQAVMINYREHNLDRDSEQSDGNPDESSARRAIFDVSFSHLGRCQIDALCQEQRFDLLVRSEEQLDHAIQQEITGLFLSACEIAGLTGEIGYQHGYFAEPATMQMSTKMVVT